MIRLAPLLLLACADNRAPVFDPPLTDQVVTVGRTVSFPVRAVDRDGDAVRYGARGLPVGSRFDPSGDPPVFRWTPLASDADASGRLHPLTFLATDEAGAETEARVVVVVHSGDSRPRFTSPSAFVLDLRLEPSLEVVLTVRDDDSAALDFELIEAPAGVELLPRGKSAVLRWTPTRDQVEARAVYGVKVGVGDGSERAEQELTIVLDTGA